MVKPIAVVDYSVDGKSGGLIKSWLNEPVEIISIKENLPFPEVLPDNFRAFIHTGSSHSIIIPTSFIEGAKRLVKSAITAKIPQMGICYGHQLLALATVGASGVARSHSIEIGWKNIDFLEDWPSDEISGSHKVWESHYDCVVEVPKGSKITATNAHTEIQAFVNKDLKLFGTQFHPEFNLENGNKAFRDDIETLNKNDIKLQEALTSNLDPIPGNFVFSDFLTMYGVE